MGYLLTESVLRGECVMCVCGGGGGRGGEEGGHSQNNQQYVATGLLSCTAKYCSLCV